jgi:hypothetical protein
MSGGAWLCVGIIALIVLACVYSTAYNRGYAVGQHQERLAVARVLADERQRGRQAEQDIEYLYGQATWQITQQGPAAAEARGMTVHE